MTPSRGRIARTLGLVLAVGVLGLSVEVHADDLKDCVRRSVSFDGIVPLTYTTVSGTPGTRAYLHGQYPLECNSDNADTCKSPAYVLPGDTLAVGKSCGKWAYTQYIGEKRITVGWIALQRINVASSAPPEAPKELSFAQRYHFTLVHGQGVPVCAAYLQRLNQTVFENAPYCGRPESTLVPGFDRLERRWLDRSQYVHLLPQVDSYLQDRGIEAFYVPRKGEDGKAFFEPPLESVLPRDYLPKTWTYDPPVDVENGSTARPLVMWSDANRKDPSRCLQYLGNNAKPDRTVQAGVILTPDHREFDGERTKVVFGRAQAPFRPIGTEVGVFRYRGVTYFDTFFDDYELGDFHVARRNDRRLRDTLGVFVHQGQRTRQLCEYYVNNQGD